ncbi:hypothetical protein ABKN59_008577 [Abortiporus biennis]
MIFSLLALLSFFAFLVVARPLPVYTQEQSFDHLVVVRDIQQLRSSSLVDYAGESSIPIAQVEKPEDTLTENYDIVKAPLANNFLDDERDHAHDRLDNTERAIEAKTSGVVVVDRDDDSEETTVGDTPPSQHIPSPYRPLVFMAFASISATIGLCVLSAYFRLMKYLRRGLLSSNTWELLPRMNKHPLLPPLPTTYHDDEEESLSAEDAHTIIQDDQESDLEEEGSTGLESPPVPSLINIDFEPDNNNTTISNADEEEDLIVFEVPTELDFLDHEVFDEMDENFHDAEETPFFTLVEDHSDDLVEEEVGPCVLTVDHCLDPDYLPLPGLPPSLPSLPRATTPYCTPPPTPPRTPHRRPIQLREVETAATLNSTRPAWSVRAANAPPLGIPSTSLAASLSRTSSSATTTTASPTTSFNTAPSSPVTNIPRTESLQHIPEVEKPAKRPRRAYRAPIPELDIALALQLRPGLGIGSDAAWLVRFLMAVFGWMAVFIGGANVMKKDQRKAIGI